MNNSQSIKKLGDIWNRGHLLPVLGAGMSIPSNLPSWLELMQQLLQYLFRNQMLTDALDITHIKNETEQTKIIAFLSQRLSALGPIVAVRYLKEMMNNPKEFSNAVYNALYYKLISDPIPSDNVYALTKLAPQSRAFLTYNFDNVLELALTHKGFKVQTIYNETQEPVQSAVTVFHPHGYLPYGEEIVWDKNYINNPIILSEDEYHDQYLDPYSWSNAIQIKCFYDSTLLLLGISATDPNMRRILEINSRHSSKKHYIVMKADESESFKWEWKQLQERVFLQLGLQVLWVNSHDEINDIFDGITS